MRACTDAIEDQKWPIVGSVTESQARRDWPLPHFANRCLITETPQIAIYSDDDLCLSKEPRVVGEADMDGLPSAALAGSESLEITLSELTNA